MQLGYLYNSIPNRKYPLNKNNNTLTKIKEVKEGSGLNIRQKNMDAKNKIKHKITAIASRLAVRLGGSHPSLRGGLVRILADEAILIIVIMTLLVFATAAHAEIPRYMQFQGKLTETDDTPLIGSQKLTFRIYDVETGGTPIWSEIHNDVDIENGVFSVLLGGIDPANNPLDVAFDKPYWISTEVDDTGEMPRTAITSAGYAYRASTIDEWVIENRTSDPESPKTGQMWFRTDL